ncbi:Hypothetical_protein [Hexamita inflata]|uniref:Hypothetical_protein n=1 Tax=Hexamita inflata TaxID=28002 RepID=A0AA86RCG2_9EUKA|nr:Hypothetical protein HINF_LOCUS37092 [Hexamita inflata]CAI9973762.1 Hypothetical protein HINF_LOCUS61407 [Hexamita inflata]
MQRSFIIQTSKPILKSQQSPNLTMQNSVVHQQASFVQLEIESEAISEILLSSELFSTFKNKFQRLHDYTLNEIQFCDKLENQVKAINENVSRLRSNYDILRKRLTK